MAFSLTLYYKLECFCAKTLVWFTYQVVFVRRSLLSADSLISLEKTKVDALNLHNEENRKFNERQSSDL